MNISVATYTYGFSAICASIQLSSFIFNNIINQQSPNMTMKSFVNGDAKSFVSFVFILNQGLFLLYNIMGWAISYNTGFLAYRNSILTRYEKYLQLFEVTIESIEKSVLFSTVILFLPILKMLTKSRTNSIDVKKEIRHFTAYVILRTCLYPSVYTILYRYPMLSSFIIEFMSISESMIMSIVFMVIDYKATKHFKHSDPHCERTNALLKHTYSRFTLVSRLYILQLMFEMVNKSGIVIMMLSSDKSISQTIIDCTFLIKLLSFSMQSFAVSKLCNVDEYQYPENAFWTPNYNKDLIFYNPYEDKTAISNIGVMYSNCYMVHSCVIKHVDAK